MKIALCLSGQMRSMRYCIDTIHTAFPDCEIDVYATAWDYEDEENVTLLKEKLNVVFFNRVSNNQLSKYSYFEQQSIELGFSNIEYIESWAPVPIWNLTRIELMAQHSYNWVCAIDKEYDYIIRSRYDTKFLQDITPLLSQNYILLTEDIGGSAEWDTWHGTRSVFDGFAAGSPKLMKKYYNFVDWLPEYFEYHNETLKAERTMGWYLAKQAKVNTAFTIDIMGIQINEHEWYNRTNPVKTDSLKNKQKNTFDFYRSDLEKNHPEMYKKIESKFKKKFSIRCAQRSGSNFLEQLIIQNTKDLHCIQSDRDSNDWKHGEWYPSYNDSKEFTCLIARDPFKWVNACKQFNADMWKWWKVNPEPGTPEELVFKYHDSEVSIPKMVARWNEFYSNWLKDQNIYFVWYPDLLDTTTRNNILDNIITKFNLIRTTNETVIPNKVLHSEDYRSIKAVQELDPGFMPLLSKIKIDYIKNNIDNDLIKLMNERREYESSSSIQW